ncbi:hypothetical protein ACP3P8_14970 [Pseudomonas aeruginosa]
MLGVVQVIDHLDDAFVLIVDDLNTGIQVILPDQMRHDDFPKRTANGLSERPGARVFCDAVRVLTPVKRDKMLMNFA